MNWLQKILKRKYYVCRQMKGADYFYDQTFFGCGKITDCEDMFNKVTKICSLDDKPCDAVKVKLEKVE